MKECRTKGKISTFTKNLIKIITQYRNRKNGDFCKISNQHFFLNNKKGKNVEQSVIFAFNIFHRLKFTLASIIIDKTRNSNVRSVFIFRNLL